MVLNRARIRQVTGVTSKTPSSPHQNLLVCCLLAGLPLPIQELQHSGGAYTSRSCGIGRRVAPIGLALHLRPVRSTASSVIWSPEPPAVYLRLSIYVPARPCRVGVGVVAGCQAWVSPLVRCSSPVQSEIPNLPMSQ